MKFKNLEDVKTYALQLMKKHGVSEDTIFLYPTRTGRWLGKYSTGERKNTSPSIQLNYKIIELNLDNFELINDTILHEIAHSLVGISAKHGKIWKEKCIEIGAIASSTNTIGNIVSPKLKWTFTCPNCGYTAYYSTRRVMACGDCCRKFNNNKYTDEYKFTVTLTKD